MPADSRLSRRGAPASADPGYERFDAAYDAFLKAMRRSRGRVSRERQLTLTMSQYHLLEALSEEPDLTVRALAEAAGVASPTATRMLDGLQRDGIVERRPSASDRRAVSVSLTDTGRRLVAQKRALVGERRRALYESLDPGERAQAERLLRRLAEAIDEL